MCIIDKIQFPEADMKMQEVQIYGEGESDKIRKLCEEAGNELYRRLRTEAGLDYDQHLVGSPRVEQYLLQYFWSPPKGREPVHVTDGVDVRKVFCFEFAERYRKEAEDLLKRHEIILDPKKDRIIRGLVDREKIAREEIRPMLERILNAFLCGQVSQADIQGLIK